MGDMSTGLPVPGESGPEQHAEISRIFLAQATEELEADDRLQASEKSWGAAAHALKAIAEQRGWNHNSHALVIATAEHLAREFQRQDFVDLIQIAQASHVNFYENIQESDSVERAISQIEYFLGELDGVRAAPPRPFRVESTSDRNRLRRLIGKDVNVGDFSPTGFDQSRIDGESPGSPGA
jgi:uncharacterized protein (UPF0332 family)